MDACHGSDLISDKFKDIKKLNVYKSLDLQMSFINPYFFKYVTLLRHLKTNKVHRIKFLEIYLR